ncbi:MAG: potassium transporter TrkG [Candidatus Nanopelagicales bacterium]
MRFPRLRTTPRSRIARAAGKLQAAERAEEEYFAELGPKPKKSEVVARTRSGRSRFNRRSPTRTVAGSFVVLCSIGTLLLMLPGMSVEVGTTSFATALFTAVSAGCVTGLATVDTATHWTTQGQAVIVLLVQVGGFGIQALGTLLALLLTKKMGATSRLAAQAETGALSPGEVRGVLRALATISLVVESLVALALAGRFLLAYELPLGQSLWMGVFHSVSAFNNAGFALASDSLMTYGRDPFILGPIAVAIFLGSLGFLVIVEVFSRATGARSLLPQRRLAPMDTTDVRRRAKELARRSRYRMGDSHPERLGFANPIPLSLHTRLTLIGTGVVLLVGFAGFALFEWANPATLGSLPWWERIMNALFSGGITPRTAGFNTVDYAAVRTETRFLTDGVMFIGGASGSTAGGVKVTTLMVLAYAVIAEIRGHADVNSLDRRIPDTTVRVAIAVVLVSAAAVTVGTMALIALSDLSLDLAMFEVVSALATVGLSANVTPTLPGPAHMLLVLLMLLGRVGPLTLASALTLRNAQRSYRLPEGRPMIG